MPFLLPGLLELYVKLHEFFTLARGPRVDDDRDFRVGPLDERCHETFPFRLIVAANGVFNLIHRLVDR